MTRCRRPADTHRFRHRGPHPLTLAVAVVISGCLDPAGTGGGFGRLSVRPAFEAGADPESIRVEVDSVRTFVRRTGETPPLVDETRPYTDGIDMSWLIELRSSDEEVAVELELRSGGSTLYRGSREVRVEAGSLEAASTEDVPVAYTGPSLASRIEVNPSRVVLSRFGARQKLEATAFDDAGIVLTGRTVAWRSTDEGVATVDDAGEITATGTGAAWVVALADGATDSASVRVDTALARSATLTADSASLRAGGAATSGVTVRLLDGDGHEVGASAGSVVLSTTLGFLGPVTDHRDGTYTATLTASTTAGTATVTGTLNGDAIQDSAIVEMAPGPAEPGTTTITADPSSLVANDSVPSTATVTVRVLDAGGNPVGRGGDDVALTATLGRVSPITDHGDGTYTATFQAAVRQGTAVITGTLNGQPIEDQATVEIVHD